MHARQPLVALAGDVWAAAFKAHFIAFWAFGQSHSLRISRLDETQHVGIHGMNAATRLAAQLDDSEALAVQRVALRNPSAGILTLSEAASELGIEGVTAQPGGGGRSPLDAARMIGEAGPSNAAKFLSYARAAWLCEEVLIVDLGERARAMQTRALHLRLRTENTNAPLPVNSTSICVCAECRRVANAYVTSATGSAFNELGVSACQIATDSGPGEVRLYCAKRSSAALRGAVAFENDMKRRCIEREQIDRAAVSHVIATRLGGDSGDPGVATRVRRDAKNALEQRPHAVACGENAMVTIPVIGRIIRVYKAWYGMCCYCASIVRVQPNYHRYGGDLCCMRCDHTMFDVDADALPSARAAARKVCRFCGLGTSTMARTLYTVCPLTTCTPPVRSREPGWHWYALEGGKGTARHRGAQRHAAAALEGGMHYHLVLTHCPHACILPGTIRTVLWMEISGVVLP